jgi:outer membrane murein-binding lipoprotein Lpp
MFRAKFLLPVLVFVTAVAVGCTQRPTAATGGNDRALEAKVAKLEKDLKTLQDEATKARTEAARQVADAAKQVADLGKERDELKVLLKARTGERDNLQAQYDTFRKDLKELLGKMDAATNVVVPPSVTLLPVPTNVR